MSEDGGDIERDALDMIKDFGANAANIARTPKLWRGIWATPI
jgi:hypothetical protein